jgi:hypothetical protein
LLHPPRQLAGVPPQRFDRPTAVLGPTQLHKACMPCAASADGERRIAKAILSAFLVNDVVYI